MGGTDKPAKKRFTITQPGYVTYYDPKPAPIVHETDDAVEAIAYLVCAIEAGEKVTIKVRAAG